MKKENNSIVPINKELNVIKYETKNIEDLIYIIRDTQVMLVIPIYLIYQLEWNINS